MDWYALIILGFGILWLGYCVAFGILVLVRKWRMTHAADQMPVPVEAETDYLGNR